MVGGVGVVGREDKMIFAVKPPEQAKQHVEDDHRAGVADVGVVVDRRAADVHPDARGIERPKGLLAPRKGVVEDEGHGAIGFRSRRAEALLGPRAADER